MNLQVLRQLLEIYFNIQIQKRIVVATTICGNTIEEMISVACLALNSTTVIMLLVGGLSLQQRQQLAAPGSAAAVPSGRSSRASTSSTTFGKNSSNGGVQSASAELDSDLLEFDENFASENHGRNSKSSAFQPRSESSLTSGMKSLI